MQKELRALTARTSLVTATIWYDRCFIIWWVQTGATKPTATQMDNVCANWVHLLNIRSVDSSTVASLAAVAATDINDEFGILPRC